jgi:F-type H+-transporting ATPase subunit c
MKTTKLVGLVCLVVLVVLGLAAPALAADTNEAGGAHTVILSGAAMGAGLGAALTMIGAGYGFGRIGSAALESMARQPEIASKIQTAMIVIAALLEGATFFALVVCVLMTGNVKW